MLARTVLTPEQLEITPGVHAAILTLLGMMERGELVHVGFRDSTNEPHVPWPRVGQFNMNCWVGYGDCGTVHCIGGSLELLAPAEGCLQSPHAMGLYHLFYPDLDSDWANITVAQAAAALRNYLSTGQPEWKSVMGEASATGDQV